MKIRYHTLPRAGELTVPLLFDQSWLCSEFHYIPCVRFKVRLRNYFLNRWENRKSKATL